MKTYRTLLALTAFVTTTQVVPAVAHAKSLSLTGNWRVYFTGSDREGADSGLSQYQQRYDARWAPLITRQIKMSADMGYTNNWIHNLGTREILNPALRFDVFNDIFAFNLNGYATKHELSYSTDRETYAWDGDLRSSWRYDLWPSLSVRLGQRWKEGDARRHDFISGETLFRGGEDEEYSYGGASVTWEAYKFRLFYDYFRADTDDRRELTTQEEERHLGQLQYADTYWKNRVNVSFSQTLSQSNTDLTDQGGGASIRVLISSAYAADDFTPSSGRLPMNQQLIDGNLDARAFTIQLQQPANLAIRTDFRTVDQIYVYTTKDTNLLVANTDAVTWDLYTSTDGFSWQRVGERVATAFNRDEFRFEVTTGTIRAAYIKLVATGWIPTLNIEVTELEARTSLTGDGLGQYSTTSNQYKTEAYLGIAPLESTHFSYNFSRDKNEGTSGNGEETDSEQLSHSARFSWDYSKYFNPSMGYNTVKNTYSHALDTESRSYDLRINSTPLSTLDNSLSFVYSEYYEDNQLELTGNNISLTTQATLYPDLTTELSLNWYLSEQELTREQSDSYYIRWLLRSRLRKSLYADFTTEYRTSSADIEIPVEDPMGHGIDLLHTSGESGMNSLHLNWRPSEILSFAATGVSTWGEEEEGDTESLMMSADYLLLRTTKTNITLRYVFNTSRRQTYNNFGFVWGWDFSRFFTLQTNGYYLLSDLENIWNISTQLTARF